MSETITFDFVSPEQVLDRRDVSMIVIPGAEGDFAVMGPHSPIMSTLIPGLVSLYEGDKIIEQIFVTGGFASVQDGVCTILADNATPLSDLDEDSVRSELETLRNSESASQTSLEIARARFQAVTGVAPS